MMVKMPPIIYGTAWKKDCTRQLVLKALRAGFRGIDTACQPRHYREELVGAGVADALAEGVIRSRSEVYLQTKFTPLSGQDPASCPYDKRATVEEQVSESVATSLKNLRTDYIDALILHSPLASHTETLRAWRQMEKHVAAGDVCSLGISNCYDVSALASLFAASHVKPKVVQNRFYADSGYDQEVRRFCSENCVTYQSFWTLTANKKLLSTSSAVGDPAERHNCTREQAWLAFVRALGCVPLSGTTTELHMAQDLELPELTDAEVKRLSKLIS